MNTQDISKSENDKYRCRHRSAHGFFSGLAIGGVLGVLAVVGFNAYSHAGWSGHAGHADISDPQVAIERAEIATDFVLMQVHASETQRQQVKAIVKGVINDLLPLHEQHRATHQAFVDALAQPTVNRVTLEQLRAGALQRAETASTRLVQAIADVAEVLTPEQRSELIQLAERFRH